MRCLTSEKAESSSASSDEDWCRTWRSCYHADQRKAQHSQSHSEGMCGVVRGQVVRRGRDQVDSGIDRCEQVGRVITLLSSQHPASTLCQPWQAWPDSTPDTARLCPSIVPQLRRYISDEFSSASSHSTHCRVNVMSTIHILTLPRLLPCHIHQPSQHISARSHDSGMFVMRSTLEFLTVR